MIKINTMAKEKQACKSVMISMTEKEQERLREQANELLGDRNISALIRYWSNNYEKQKNPAEK